MNEKLRPESPDWEKQYQGLIQAIRRLPDAAPPAGFADGVLHGLEPKRLPWWRRAWLWAQTPRPMAVTPLRMAGAGLVVGLLLLAVIPLRGPARVAEKDARSGGLSTVTFRLPDPGGRIRSAAVIGSFNRWKPKGFEMRFVPDRGAWLLQTRLPAGSYEYVFLLNETQALPDPGAVLSREDGFGSTNSVLLLDEDHAQAI